MPVKTITKRDLAMKIADKSNITVAQAGIIFQGVLDLIIEELGRGNTIELRNFGVFDVKRRKGRPGRNPNRPRDEYDIPDRMTARFRAGKVLKEKLALLDKEKL